MSCNKYGTYFIRGAMFIDSIIAIMVTKVDLFRYKRERAYTLCNCIVRILA